MVTQKIGAVATEALNDLDIFHKVRVQGRSVDLVAEEVEANYFEIREAVARVTEKLLAAAPAEDDEGATRRRQYLSEQIAAERLNWLFRLAIQSHKQSFEDVTITRRAGMAEPIVTTRSSTGQERWLRLAGKIAEMATKIPAASLHDPLLAEIVRANAEEVAQNPPEEDCSAQAKEVPVAAAASTTKVAASADPLMACVQSMLAKKDAAKCAARPVQPTVQPTAETLEKLARMDRAIARQERARAEFLSG